MWGTGFKKLSTTSKKLHKITNSPSISQEKQPSQPQPHIVQHSQSVQIGSLGSETGLKIERRHSEPLIPSSPPKQIERKECPDFRSTFSVAVESWTRTALVELIQKNPLLIDDILWARERLKKAQNSGSKFDQVRLKGIERYLEFTVEQVELLALREWQKEGIKEIEKLKKEISKLKK
mmetsp:Transcript_14331/g.19888  ORF Transcript_14331/g.19888 Transcript_14331/m.19888 type:complete len:178 (+) Transcript_14331:1261-1794(+)